MIATIGAINSVQRMDPDAQALINRAIALGFTLPSQANITLINNFFIAAKSAAGGTLAPFIDIRMYINDLGGSGLLGFDSIHWNNPLATLIQGSGALTKTAKKGYSQTANAGYIISNTLLDSSDATNRVNLSAMWVWFDTISVGLRQTGIAFGSDSRAISSYPKYSSTNAILNMAGRSFDFAQSDGDHIVQSEVNGTTVSGYLDNAIPAGASPTTTNWSVTNFNCNMIDLGLNIGSTPTPIIVGTNKVPDPVKLGACLIWRTTAVNRTQLYNAVLAYKNGVAALP